MQKQVNHEPSLRGRHVHARAPLRVDQIELEEQDPRLRDAAVDDDIIDFS